MDVFGTIMPDVLKHTFPPIIGTIGSLSLTRTRSRDELNVSLLKRLGWDVMTVWDCELKDMTNITKQLICFLEEPIADYL